MFLFFSLRDRNCNFIRMAANQSIIKHVNGIDPPLLFWSPRTTPHDTAEIGNPVQLSRYLHLVLVNWLNKRHCKNVYQMCISPAKIKTSPQLNFIIVSEMTNRSGSTGQRKVPSSFDPQFSIGSIFV